MRRVVRILVPVPAILGAALLVAASGLGGSTASAEPRQLDVAPSPTGEAYEKAISRRGISADVDYYDPSREAPPLVIRGKAPDLKPPAEQGGGQGLDRWLVVVIAAVLLAAVIALGVSFGGAASTSFTGRSDDRRRSTGGLRQPAGPDMAMPLVDPTLAEIARMTDPREAIVALGRASVRRAAEMNGLGIGRSWTMRDVLRRLPQGWPHLGALYGIARAAEITHFGGRDIDMHEVNAHMEAARPIFAEVRA